MPDSPGLIRSGLNLAAAIAKYIAAGCPRVTEQIYTERLTICGECNLCRRGKCLNCGCYVERKAKMATEACPLAKWPAVELKQEDSQ